MERRVLFFPHLPRFGSPGAGESDVILARRRAVESHGTAMIRWASGADFRQKVRYLV